MSNGLVHTKLWRGGKKSETVRSTTASVKFEPRKDEMCLWFDQGGMERGTRFQFHIGRDDFLTLVAAMGNALNRE